MCFQMLGSFPLLSDLAPDHPKLPAADASICFDHLLGFLTTLEHGDKGLNVNVVGSKDLDLVFQADTPEYVVHAKYLNLNYLLI